MSLKTSMQDTHQSLIYKYIFYDQISIIVDHQLNASQISLRHRSPKRQYQG